MPTNQNNNETQKLFSLSSYDKDLIKLAKRIANAYGDNKVRLLASRDVRRAVLLRDIDSINKVIAQVPKMSEGQRMDFCDAFVGENMEGLDLATPFILGEAYRTISARVRNGENDQQARLDKLAARIDDLSTDFANSGGMVVSQKEWPLIDVANIADADEGFRNMLDARKVDVEENSEKLGEIEGNLKIIDFVVSNYDEAWNLKDLREADVARLADRYDDIDSALRNGRIYDETKATFAEYKMLDNKGNAIPQYTSGKRDDKEKHTEYQPGFNIIKGSRFDSIIELTRQEIARKVLMDFDQKIDEDKLEEMLNDEVVKKLHEIFVSDKVVRAANEDPEKFNDQKYLEEFVNSFDGKGGEISDTGYNAAIENQTNETIGWAARIKNKIGGASKKLDSLWTRVNRPLNRIDDMADVRMSRAAVARRKKRRDFCWRTLKSFDVAFIASAFITTVARIAAAQAGIKVATALALVGGGSALTMMGIQVARWYRTRKKAGLPTNWEAFRKDQTLIRSLITSALGISAMALAVADKGYGALAVGGAALILGAFNNGITEFRIAKDEGASARQAAARGILRAGAAIAGGFGGRYVAQGLINMYNRVNPENTLLQNKEMVKGEPEKISDEVRHSRTVTNYTDEMLQSARDAVENWYAKDYPNNPEILQQDIDAINQYNADHNTNLDPYRILRAMKISQPSRLVYTPGWADANHVPQELIAQAAHAVGNGTYDPAGMAAAEYLDANYLGETGQAGAINGHTINKTYSPINELPTKTVEEWVDPAVYRDTFVPRYEAAHGDGIGTLGEYDPRGRKAKVNDAWGSFAERVRRSLNRDKAPKDASKDAAQDVPVSHTDDELQDNSVLKRRQDYVAPITTISPREPRRDYVAPVATILPREPIEKVEPKDNIEPIPEVVVAPQEQGELHFAITYTQAKKWDDLHERLKHVRTKLGNSSLPASAAADLRAQKDDIVYQINRLRNQMGRPTDTELYDAVADAYRREYKKLMAEKPDERYSSHRAVREWNEKKQYLKEKLAEYGYAEPLDESSLYFPAPVLGVQAQKQSERDVAFAAEREKRETQPMIHLPKLVMRHRDQEKRGPKYPQLDLTKPLDLGRKQQIIKEPVPEYVQPVVERKKPVKSEPVSLMEIRGVPVELMVVTRYGDRFVQNDGLVMVFVDIDGLRIPFYLANGNNPDEPGVPGHWYPLFTVCINGEYRFVKTKDYIEGVNGEPPRRIAKIDEISKILDERIGDIRKDKEGFPTIDPEIIYSLVENTPNTIYSHMIWGPSYGNKQLIIDLGWLESYLSRIKAPDYLTKKEKRQKERQERRQERREKLGAFGNLLNNLDNRVRHRFGRGDDSYEH